MTIEETIGTIATAVLALTLYAASVLTLGHLPDWAIPVRNGVAAVLVIRLGRAAVIAARKAAR